VSRRTIYRYFETKDDLIFDAPREWVEVLDATMASRVGGESTRDVYRRALLDVSRHIEADADRVLRAFAILQSSPSLSMRHGRSDAEWTARIVELVAPDVAAEPDGDLQSLAAAMSLVAAGNALIATWAVRGPEADLVAMTRAVLDQMDSVWPAASR
jgi:AcrR family transcriptional regulator